MKTVSTTIIGSAENHPGNALGFAALLLAMASTPVLAAPADVFVDDDYASLGAGTPVDWPYTGAGIYQVGADAFATIQAAVNAVEAGGTVHVAAGVYGESQVLIAKSVQVLGAGEAVTAIDGGNAALAAPGVVRITTGAGNVRFDGFSIRNPGAAAGVRAGIYASSPASGNTYVITRNRLIGTGDLAQDQDHGLYAADGQEHLVFETNSVTTTRGQAVLIERHAGPVDIRCNTLDVGVSGSTAVFVMTCDNTHVTSAQRVVGNSIDVGTGGPFDVDHGCSGIAFVGACTGTPGRFTNIEITDNNVRRVVANRQGISLANFAPAGQETDGEISGAVIAGNTVTDSTQSLLNNTGIRLVGQVRNTRIRDNTVGRFLLPAMEQVERNGHSGVGTAVGPNNQIHHNVGGVVVRAGTASVRNNSLTENTTAIYVGGGTTKVLVESNEFSGTYGPGLHVESGAIVDAGDCLNRNVTGLGSSAGGNRLVGFGFDGVAPHAIENWNYGSVGHPPVLAYNNDFGATAADDIEALMVDDTDFSGFSAVEFSQAGPLLVSCPPAITVTGSADVPTAATTLADFRAQGGVVSSSPATVSSSDGPLTPGPTEGTITRTYTVTDACGKTATCVQTITVDAAGNQPPTITCPSDVILPCADCNIDPSNTGMASAADDGNVRVSYSDSVRGECPKVVTRTWMATDDSGQTASCDQTITCLPPSLVTDSGRCLFDRDPATPVQDFRLIFTQDPQNWPCYRLTASNPGQFMYNVLYTGAPGESASFEVTIPYPFVTQGANPVQAYDWISVSGGNGQACLMPGNPFFVSAQQVALPSYGNPLSATTTLRITLTVPDSGVVFLAIHLDYGLKKESGYTKNAAGDAVDCATGTQVLIPNNGSYQFAVSGAQNGTARIQSFNVFKKNPGVAGLVLYKNSNDPFPGSTVTLANAKGVRIGSSVTDEDGFYMIAYKHKGKAATYSLSVVTPTGYNEKKAVTLKANAFLDVGFWVP